jgi:carbonic anhydrase/acetyltransferase-like protein (isoleucine patch superfamily)
MPLFSLGERRIELVGRNQYIAYDATLIGSVTLHADANIWFKVVIRAENDRITIGEGTNVQDASVLHVDPGYPMSLGRLVSIGHKVMLHGCTIGDGTLIGINSVVLNGAKIGKGVLVLGSPGKVVRELNAEERANLLGIARGYVARAHMYREELRPTPQSRARRLDSPT